MKGFFPLAAFLAVDNSNSLAFALEPKMPRHISPTTGSDRLDGAALSVEYFGNDAAWYLDRIPFFECSDEVLQDVYYYRWTIFRAHQRDNGAQGYISTEFLNDVSWQLNPWASLNDATGFHLNEGRWLRDRRFSDDYINFLYSGGDDRHFTDYLPHSIWSRYLVDGDVSGATAHLAAMVSLYNTWNDHFDTSKGLYWIMPLYDATEYTISSIDASGGQDGFFGGEAFRPSINSYMWASAAAISEIYNLTGDKASARTWSTSAETLKATFQHSNWNSSYNHFIDRYYTNTSNVRYWDFIRGRELVGYVPWMFNMPDRQYSVAWEHITDTSKLLGANGYRTAEPSYPYYMRQYRYDAGTGLRECQWNGPVWPFQTTQVLLGMANLLNNHQQSIITPATYMSGLRQYSRLHYLNDSNLLDLQENYEPDEHSVIVGLPRSHHYFHSGFNDLIISGLVGLRPQADDSIVVKPLIDSSITHFALQGVLYHGHNISITWDATGARYRSGAGLCIDIDGKQASHTLGLDQVRLAVPRRTPPDIHRPIALSTPVGAEYPKGSATSGYDSVPAAIDGRVFFFPEEANGWESDVTSVDSIQAYTIDFGQPTAVERAELALYVDDQAFVLPCDYNISHYDGHTFQKVPEYGEPLLANGITNVRWSTLNTSRLQFSFTQIAGKQTRLVEFKVF